MPELNDLISLLLVWLLIGSAVWAYSDPGTLYDRALRKFIARNGRLPRQGAMVLVTVGLIVFWPKLARALWERV